MSAFPIRFPMLQIALVNNGLLPCFRQAIDIRTLLRIHHFKNDVWPVFSYSFTELFQGYYPDDVLEIGTSDGRGDACRF